MNPKGLLFERVIWVNALMRYFENKPAASVLEALGIDEQALAEAREDLHAEHVESTGRGDLERAKSKLLS